MRLKKITCTFLLSLLFIISLTVTAQAAVDIRQISRIRNQQTLTDMDLLAIDRFVAQAVDNLLKSRDFAETARVRTIISENSKSQQKKYVQRYLNSAYKHISDALQKSQQFPADWGFKVKLNLLILIREMAQPKLAELATDMITDKNQAVRYWAVKAAANPILFSTADSSATANLLKKVVSKLQTILADSEPETIVNIAKFAAAVSSAQTEDLLLKVAQARISRYTQWQIKKEFPEGIILKLLYGKMTSQGPLKKQFARQFSILLSCTIQRYIKGQGYLSQAQQNQIASVLISVESNCLSKLFGRTQVGIKRALTSNDISALQAEHDKLLGNAAGRGMLADKFNFSYGKTLGSKQTAPNKLPAPPADKTK